MPDQEVESQGAEERALEALREILVGGERAELAQLRSQLEQQVVDVESVARVLPAAIKACGDKEEVPSAMLSSALAPSVESAIEVSVSRNPRVLTDAIFPLMGPAIRKSIRQALAELSESVNRTLEQNLSLTGLRWRLDSIRTGVPFSEIVLKNSLICRVEQVLLIHRDSGLLLAHATAASMPSSDPDMVSAMLGAISDFASDSFNHESGDDLTQVEFGESVLEVARSPSVILACEIRGVLSVGLRKRIQETVEAIHSTYARALTTFQGDPAPFAPTASTLAALLVEEAPAKAKRGIMGNVMLALLVVGVVGICTHLFLSQRTERLRWGQAQAALAAEPGLAPMVTRREGDGYIVSGLRDRLARDPMDILHEVGLDTEQVHANWTPFESLDGPIVRERARQRLEPPASVRLSWEGTSLSLAGSAPHRWVMRARALHERGALVGVDVLDQTQLVDTDLLRAASAADVIGKLTLQFQDRKFELQDDSRLASFRDRFGEFERHCRESGLSFRVHIDLPYDTDPDGALLHWQRRSRLEQLLVECSSWPERLQLAPSVAIIPASPGTIGPATERVAIRLEVLGVDN